MGGSYLAQAAKVRFGDRALTEGYFVVGELPQSGAIPAMRTEGQIAGFLASLPGFPPERIIRIDTKNTLQYSFQQMSNALARIPQGAPILITAINDQSVSGMLRAVQQQGRGADALVVGKGADELETMVAEENFIASVAYFPERYGNYLIPLSLMRLAGHDVPLAVTVNHVMISPPISANSTPSTNAKASRTSTSSSHRKPLSNTWRPSRTSPNSLVTSS